MAHQWKAGDLAKCVRPNGEWVPYSYNIPAPLNAPEQYGVYRVRAVALTNRTLRNFWRKRLVVLELVGIRGRYNCCYFRPILPAEPAFTEAMRSLRPKVEA